MIDAGWVKEIKARNGAPIWRKDTVSGETYALKLTAKGLQAATAKIEATDGESAPLVTPAGKKTGTPARRAAPYSERLRRLLTLSAASPRQFKPTRRVRPQNSGASTLCSRPTPAPRSAN